MKQQAIKHVLPACKDDGKLCLRLRLPKALEAKVWQIP